MKNNQSINLTKTIGLGIAGNFTGHLEQAGEASDFKDVEVKDSNAPKGIFPFYVPVKVGSFIDVYPLSSTIITPPAGGGNLQIEPEVALVCDIKYKDNQVVSLTPVKFAAYNDCSIRKEGAKKISEKKNWGANSKGMSEQFIDIDKFDVGGVMDKYRIACYLLRDNKLHTYGVNSAVNGYSYFYQKLLDWTILKMNTQLDNGPLESISILLKQSDYPKYAVISIGATRYTDFGAKMFLQKGDDVFVVLYDAGKYDINEFEIMIKDKDFPSGDISTLHQRVT